MNNKEIRTKISRLDIQIRELVAKKQELEEMLPSRTRVYGDPLVEMS